MDSKTNRRICSILSKIGTFQMDVLLCKRVTTSLFTRYVLITLKSFQMSYLLYKSSSIEASKWPEVKVKSSKRYLFYQENFHCQKFDLWNFWYTWTQKFIQYLIWKPSKVVKTYLVSKHGSTFNLHQALLKSTNFTSCGANLPHLFLHPMHNVCGLHFN